jgi:hypothetical protein
MLGPNDSFLLLVAAKEPDVTYINALSCHLFEVTEENHKNPQLRWPLV